MATEEKDDKNAIGPKSRNRGEQRKWAEWETRRFLMAIASLVKKDRSRFMKPTCERFFAEVCKVPSIKHLGALRFQVLRDKLRHQRGTYDKALQIISKQSDSTEETDETALAEKIRKVCPNFITLKNIYGDALENELSMPDGSDSCEGIDPLQNSCIELKTEIKSAMSDDDDDEDQEWTSYTQTKIEKLNNGIEEKSEEMKNSCKCQSVEDYEILVQKLQRQEDLEEQKIQLERDRFQLEKERFAYLRFIEKYKFDKEMELRRYEIELKYKLGRQDEELL